MGFRQNTELTVIHFILYHHAHNRNPTLQRSTLVESQTPLYVGRPKCDRQPLFLARCQSIGEFHLNRTQISDYSRVQRFSAWFVFLMISLYMSQQSVSSRNFRLFAEWLFVGVLFLACTLRKSIVSIVYSGLLIICIWNLSKKKKSSRVCTIVAVALSTLVACGHIVATFISQKVGCGEWRRSFSGWRSSDSIQFVSGILEF